MPERRWTVTLTPDAVTDKYKVARGEAARLSEALAVLYAGPRPPGVKPYGDGSLANVYEYTRNGYRIIFEVLAQPLTICVHFFEPVSAGGV
jgi:mRNA-degrading endonuclease RelE of RelBE toxin-antitoxin system